MNQFKKAQVLLLPTEKASQLCIYNKELYYVIDGEFNLNRDKYNIYIASDDKIEDGDWCYDKRPNEEGIFCDIIYQVKDIKLELRSSTERKIIATTNQNLNIK